MQQEQPKYFKAVPVSEKPKKDGAYLMIFADGLFSNISYYYKEGQWAHPPHLRGYTHYLEPIHLPDAAVLRSALEELVLFNEATVIALRARGFMEAVELFTPKIAIAREALSQTGDGWIRCEDGLPPIDYKDEWNKKNNITVDVWTYGYFGMKRGRFFVNARIWTVDGASSSDGIKVSHWKPLPSPPIK